MQAEPKYWFPAKRYGWGWGPPSVWQGWIVFIFFGALQVGGGVFLLPLHPGAFLAYSGVLCSVLVAVCWLKGEPPRWRWGDQ
ncbi:hypothetical protein DVJ77_04290 [Dyella tabacisoli]|uniref:DUF4175 domain-containing protein n=1 Tax=Dyella tabacisoli TaxID=2282381 RepID=A0A369UQ18_9GAMM|nr:hypothetical protein DVJ77_04290 [Dyella tabacisoli]